MKMAKLKFKSAWVDKEYNIGLRLVQYADSGNLAIVMMSYTDDGFYDWDFAQLTVNLGDKLPSNQGYVDTNILGMDVCEWIFENHLGCCLPELKQSGLCVYPLFEFDMEELIKYTWFTTLQLRIILLHQQSPEFWNCSEISNNSY